MPLSGAYVAVRMLVAEVPNGPSEREADTSDGGDRDSGSASPSTHRREYGQGDREHQDEEPHVAKCDTAHRTLVPLSDALSRR